jgi:predicted metal-dependent phosphoesterase TrpH
MHTTASDGRLAPGDLVARAGAAGLTTISVTDHDTTAALADVATAAEAARIRVVPGIELTAVDQGRDVHMLGYFFDPASSTLAALLVSQRALRVTRVREIARTLASLNMPIDVEAVLVAAAARPGASVGRPQVARALVRAGHVPSVQEAFDRWLASGRPAFVPRTGPAPADVIETIHGAGGIASFAHPGVTRRDELIAPLVERGLDAIEVYHSDHTPEDVVAYKALAVRLGVLVSGGSDFHGEDSFAHATGPRSNRPQRSTLGVITLPAEDLSALENRARIHRGAGGADS